YSIVRGFDKVIPVDVYLSAIIDAITKLRKKLSREIYEDQIKPQQGESMFYYQSKISYWPHYSYWKL
ncbi:unnamed protein product, partial [Linum tenue]